MSLIIKDLSKHYGSKQVLNSLSLNISPGVFGLIGPNGAGKTTLMEIIATIQRADKGEILLNGHNLISNHEYFRSQLGYLPQQFGFYPNLTAVEFLDYLLLFFQIDSPIKRKEKIEEVLTMVGLTEVIDEKLKTYSGGMIRRLGIAQSILNDPKLLIVDEPTTGLDPEERIRFRQLLSGLIRNDPSRIVIISTHIINDIVDIANDIGILKKGELLFFGTPREFINKNQEKIWEIETDDIDGFTSLEKYQILKSFPEVNKVRYQIIANNPPHNAKRVMLDLESAYFAFMREVSQ